MGQARRERSYIRGQLARHARTPGGRGIGIEMPGSFILKKSAKGHYYFVLKAANGETIAQSENYATKSAALTGIEAVKKHAAAGKLTDKSGG